MQKKIEFITTGNEIVSGMTLDTNFSWAAQQFMSVGLSPEFHTSVGDDEIALGGAYKNAYQRADFVIVSGGLGPTEDDLTTSAAAKFFQAPLKLNEDAYEKIKEKLDKRGRKVLDGHKKQAMFPKGAKIIDNTIGTSPGFIYKHKDVQFYFLPGVPKEFKAMVNNFVLPHILKDSASTNKLSTKIIKTLGLGESEVSDKLKGLCLGEVNLSYRIYFPEIHLMLSSSGKTDAEADKKISKALSLINEKLGNYIFSYDDENMEEVVAKLLKDRKLTIATAESCTGGLMANFLTDIPGSSEYFLRGVIVYSNKSKVDLLGVPKELIEGYGAVSSEVVESMASGVKKLSGTDIGVGISGIAGPGGGTDEKPVGTVYIGVNFKDQAVFSNRYSFHGSRKEIKQISSKCALDIIRKLILNNV